MRRALVWIMVVLLVLGGAYLCDNLFRGYAENRVAEAINTELGVEGASVTLGGVPFATALVTRSVPSAHLELDAVPLEISGHKVELTDVTADASDIRLEGDAVHVTSLTGTATLSYTDLAELAQVPVTYAGDGRLELRYTREFFGREFSFAVSALPELDVAGQVIRLTDPKVDLAGANIEVNLTQDQLDAIVEPINVQLDNGLRLTSMAPDDSGVHVGVSGENLTLPMS
jgi:hypothetical protein